MEIALAIYMVNIHDKQMINGSNIAISPICAHYHGIPYNEPAAKPVLDCNCQA